MDFQIIEGRGRRAGALRSGKARIARGHPARLEHARDGWLRIPWQSGAALPGRRPAPRWCSAPLKTTSRAHRAARRLGAGAKRIHHEALRQGTSSRRNSRKVGLFTLPGVVGPAIRSCLYQLASGRDMSAETNWPGQPLETITFGGGGHPWQPDVTSAIRAAGLAGPGNSRHGCRPPVDIHQKSFPNPYREAAQ